MLERSSISCARVSIWVAVCFLFALPTSAGERFVHAPLSSLKFEGAAPTLPLSIVDFASRFDWSYRPYAVLDGTGEAFFDYGPRTANAWENWYTAPSGITLRIEGEDAPKGRLFLPDTESKSFKIYRFEVTAPAAEAEARTRFYESMWFHYDRLMQSAIPGTAWFRHRRDAAERALGTTAATRVENAGGRDPADALELFSGARAVAENLDLDRGLRVASDEEATVDITSIEGVTTRALDWKALIKDMQPELDPLAKLVPADQHAVFFPSFEAMTRVFDDIDATGTPLLEFFETRVEDQLTKERYQEQLCLPLSVVGRILGPAVVTSVALTGSDPFLPSGADIVVLFDCKSPALLENFLAMRRAEAEKHGAEHVAGKVGTLEYVGCATPDRRISCYTARIESVVIVTNSVQALVRIAQTAQDTARSLLAADEYVWFRDRYKRGQDKESALLILTDATIRRWAGPHSRIGEARRSRAAAAMAEITARKADLIASKTFEVGASAADPDFPVSSDFVFGPDGVRSPRWGTLRFLTPISELGVARVSPAERDAYGAYRQGFQARWRNYFDPIAVRFSFDAAHMQADVTIMPLTIETEYRELRDLTRDGEIPAKAGDPHAGALFHFATALNKGSELGRALTDIAGPAARAFGADPLAWLGASAALYGERDPWWEEAREAGGLFRGEDVDYYRLPLVIQLDVKDPLKLAVFLTALRAFADESGPNLTLWENRKWNDVTYVRVAPSESLGLDEPGRDPALYYVPLPDALVISLREDLIKNAIDRRSARKAGQAVEGSDQVWIGKSAALRLDSAGIDVLTELFGSRSERESDAVWSTIPILNEWKRRYPSVDPVITHERLFGVRLATPGSRPLVWNEEFQSMESPEFGLPGTLKATTTGRRVLAGISSVQLGLTFEADGLRVGIEIIKQR
ncbi:MAG: hypothetical protein JNL28_12700 [Planctomycetes bacterium]|nr:hypothetical protein [Planctomycetota bacterium]